MSAPTVELTPERRLGRGHWRAVVEIDGDYVQLGTVRKCDRATCKGYFVLAFWDAREDHVELKRDAGPYLLKRWQLGPGAPDPDTELDRELHEVAEVTR